MMATLTFFHIRLCIRDLHSLPENQQTFCFEHIKKHEKKTKTTKQKLDPEHRNFSTETTKE